MKSIILPLFALFLTIQLHAQATKVSYDPTFVKFHHDFDESLNLAKASNKKVLMIFSGSDWCKPCIQLRNNILTKQEFAQFSKDKLVLLELDFPYRKKNKLPADQKRHNDTLAEQYNSEGAFPKLILFDDNRQPIGELQYNTSMTSAQLIEKINEVLAN